MWVTRLVPGGLSYKVRVSELCQASSVGTIGSNGCVMAAISFACFAFVCVCVCVCVRSVVCVHVCMCVGFERNTYFMHTIKKFQFAISV